jgi:site-specific recombinase XerD
LRAAKKAKISGVRGKGGTSRTVFLGADGRTALADYLEHERPTDAGPGSTALFHSAASIGSPRADGRLSPRSINLICEQIDGPRGPRRLRLWAAGDARGPSAPSGCRQWPVR